MTRQQIYILFFASVVLQLALFALLIIAPANAWYSAPVALCLAIYTGLAAGKLIGALQ